jgi:hypothetical protein
MKRIIRQDGPKPTDRELALEKLRAANGDISALSVEEARAIHVTNFHDSEYEYSINHWLSRRSLALLEDLTELGIYGEDEPAEVGARLVDEALKQFAQYDVEPEQSFEEQLSEVDPHGDHEGTINHHLSGQSLYLLHKLAKLEIYGETIGEVGARFVDLALQRFVERPRFLISRKRSI